MSRILGLVYGVIGYAVGLGSLVYAIFFLNNLVFPNSTVVPRTIDDGHASSMGVAIAVNLALCTLFAVQHSVMARIRFKQVLTRAVPTFVERSTYCLMTGLALIALYAFWQPLPQVVWSVESPALRTAIWGLQAFGWAFLVAATFMLNHFELFGMSQVVANAQGRAFRAPTFRTPGFYRFVRHPIQVGVLIAFWATPEMSLGHLILATAITGYIVVALKAFEEPDLVRQFGEQYTNYQKRVGMLFPRVGGGA